MYRTLILALDGVMDSSLALTRDAIVTADRLSALRSNGTRFAQTVFCPGRSRIRTGLGTTIAVQPEIGRTRYDALVVPGLGLTKAEEIDRFFARRSSRAVVEWLKRHRQRFPLVGASCSAVFLLADHDDWTSARDQALALLDGHRAPGRRRAWVTPRGWQAGRVAACWPGSGNHFPGMGATIAKRLPAVLHRQQQENAYLAAVAAEPGYALPHYNLGVLYELYLQRLEPALAHFETYQELSGADEEVEKWIVDLKRRIAANQRTANVTE